MKQTTEGCAECGQLKHEHRYNGYCTEWMGREEPPKASDLIKHELNAVRKEGNGRSS